MSPKLRRAADYGLIWAGLTLALLWPAIINGGPIWFPDSFAYLNGPRTALEMLTGSGTLSGFSEPAASAVAPEPYAGRSIYFGFGLYAVTSLFGLWGGPASQAGLFAAVLIVGLRPFVVHRRRGTLFVGLCVAVFSAAPFYASFLMPDFLGGLLILSAIRLLEVPSKPGRWETALLWCVTAYAAMSHTGNVMMLALLVVIAPLAFRLTGHDFQWRRVRPLVAAVFVAGVGSLLFTAMVVEVYGKPPLRPPFLSARVVADGPGYLHLQEACDPPRYALCGFADRPPGDAASFLWSKNPETGIWAVADADTRREISEQDLAFATNSFLARPLQQARASLTRFAEQARWFGLEDFRYSPGLLRMIDDWWAGDAGSGIRASRLYRDAFLLEPIDTLYKIAVILSTLHLVVLAGTRRAVPVELDELRRGFVLFAVLVVLCLLGNAAIFGVLSSPAPRYQGRAVWLLPMMSAIVIWREILWENVLLGYRRPPPAE